MWPSNVKNINKKQQQILHTYLHNTHAHAHKHTYTHASSFTRIDQ